MSHRKDAHTAAVFSHPNHELAIFGLIQRLRPSIIVYLTDGGGQTRVSETKAGLRSINLLNHATFLNYPEQSFYESLLARDSRFYSRVVDRVSKLLEAVRPSQVLCDAVEFYNPVHDLALPIVRAALRARSEVAVFEVPLCYQESRNPDDYEIQRLPVSRANSQVEVHLTATELEKKLDARDHIYSALLKQMGPLISQLTRAHLGLEVVATASSSLPEPDSDRILRYEWRGELLRSRGKVKDVITYSRHFLPVASPLFH